MVDSTTIFGQLVRKVVPTHDIGSIVVAVHAEDKASGNKCDLVCCDDGTVVRIGLGLPLSPCHPRVCAPYSQVAEGLARKVRRLKVTKRWTAAADLCGVEAFHNVFDGGGPLLNTGITAVWVSLNRATQMLCLA